MRPYRRQEQIRKSFDILTTSYNESKDSPPIQGKVITVERSTANVITLIDLYVTLLNFSLTHKVT